MTLRTCSERILLFLAVVFISACKTYYPLSENASLAKVTHTFPADTSVSSFYRPYKDSLDKIMKIPVAELEVDLVKKLPESTLGNMMSDIAREKTREYTGDPIDLAILNYGGIRVQSLTKGTLNVEHAYLLMPFDNYLVELQMSGQQLKDFCDSIASKKGWPVSGLSFKIKNSKAADILVNHEPLDPAKNYKVAMVDYVANGGDDMTLLKKIPQKQTGKLLRDAILEYWKEQTRAGKKISAKLENRITYAE